MDQLGMSDWFSSSEKKNQEEIKENMRKNLSNEK
jgi:hypothetical protein